MLLMLLLMQPQFCFCFWLLPLATFAECCQASQPTSQLSLLCRFADWNYLARLAASQQGTMHDKATKRSWENEEEELGNSFKL